MRRLSILLATLLALFLGVPGTAQAGTESPGQVPLSMAAAGDSITRAYDATVFGCFLADCPANSWATGTSSTVKSHFLRLRAVQPALTVTNVAKTGAKMGDLNRQLGLLAGSNVQYVTVLLGANDVCTSSLATMTPNATYTTAFTTADVSTIDYFHPSIAGQAKLARITWAASYWPTR